MSFGQFWGSWCLYKKSVYLKSYYFVHDIFIYMRIHLQISVHLPTEVKHFIVIITFNQIVPFPPKSVLLKLKRSRHVDISPCDPQELRDCVLRKHPTQRFRKLFNLELRERARVYSLRHTRQKKIITNK